MLKLFLLIPFFTLNAATTLGLIYFTIFINPELGLLIGFVLVFVLLVLLVVVTDDSKNVGKES